MLRNSSGVEARARSSRGLEEPSGATTTQRFSSPRVESSSRRNRSFSVKNAIASSYSRTTRVTWARVWVTGISTCELRGNEVRCGEFENEAGADGGIVFYANAAAMFGYDAGGDGETEAGAAILGGEVRKEEFVLVVRGDAMTGVGDDDFDGIEIGFRPSFNGDVLNERGFECFSGIVNEVDDDAAEQWGVGADGGSLSRKRRGERDAIETAGENFDGFADDIVDVRGIEFGGGEANELREFVDEGGQGTDFAFDEARGFFDQASEFGVAGSGIARFGALLEVVGETLRGKLNRSEGIFDFVSDAASNFLPGGGFLRAEEFGEVVENENEARISAARTERADGYGGVQQAAACDDLQFARNDAGTKSTAEQIADGASVFGAEQILEGARVFGGCAENFNYGWIGAKDVAIGVERENAGRNIFQDSFDELAAAFEFLHGLLKIACELINLRTGVAELSGHGVEGADQRAEFVVGLFGDLIVEISRGDFSGAFGEGLDGNGDLFGEIKSEPEDR